MAKTNHRNAGIVGVGNMGGAMAQHLLELGYDVGVRDIVPGRETEAAHHGARIFPTPAALAAAHRVVIVAVVDAAQCEAVLFGADGVASASSAGACVMLCPTIGPASVESLAARLAERGIDCIDAPMSGGPARARDGSMSLMVACADAAFAAHEALIGALSSRVFRV
ncbi:MAG: NAD(P)-binding domain-containing protein, partial [Caldimonas sp.]